MSLGPQCGKVHQRWRRLVLVWSCTPPQVPRRWTLAQIVHRQSPSQVPRREFSRLLPPEYGWLARHGLHHWHIALARRPLCLSQRAGRSWRGVAVGELVRIAVYLRQFPHPTFHPPVLSLYVAPGFGAEDIRLVDTIRAASLVHPAMTACFLHSRLSSAWYPMWYDTKSFYVSFFGLTVGEYLPDGSPARVLCGGASPCFSCCGRSPSYSRLTLLSSVADPFRSRGRYPGGCTSRCPVTRTHSDG